MRPAVVEARAPERFRIHFDASAELRDKLERLQDLMRSSVPDADLATVIDEAVTEKLERLEAKRFASRPRFGALSTSATVAGVPTGTGTGGVARNATTSSTTTARPSPAAASTARKDSPFTVGPTTSYRPSRISEEM